MHGFFKTRDDAVMWHDTVWKDHNRLQVMKKQKLQVIASMGSIRMKNNIKATVDDYICEILQSIYGHGISMHCSRHVVLKGVLLLGDT